MKVRDVRRGNDLNFTETREEIYTALENVDLNLHFTRKEVLQMNRYIAAGLSLHNIRQIADEMGRKQEEVLLLMADRTHTDQITASQGVDDSFIALESIDVNWFWSKAEVKEVDRLHDAGENIFSIAKKLNRALIDVLVLVVDRGLTRKSS